MLRTQITFHSFVDLITNSSSEIYVSATEKTVKTICELIDSFFAVGGSSHRCKDVFDVYLVVSGEDADGGNIETYHKTYSDASKAVETLNEQGGTVSISRNIEIQAKPGFNNSQIQEIIKKLNTLSDTYDIEERYNG